MTHSHSMSTQHYAFTTTSKILMVVVFQLLFSQLDGINIFEVIVACWSDRLWWYTL